jgi:chromosomal replication initiation ATPase DnaA
MIGEPQQLVLDLPHRAALGLEDFLVSGSNAAAVDLVDRWPDWPHWALLVVGPEGSGKTHLGQVWCLKSGAEAIRAAALTEADVGRLERARALLIEDIDRGIGDAQTLFHLLNMAREHRLSLLITSRRPPGELPIALPDLRSRLCAAPVTTIEVPDETLLRSVLVKLFADRQLVVEPHVIGHLALHLDRSMKAAIDIVATCDRLALARQRRVTRAIAAEALAEIAGDQAPQ